MGLDASVMCNCYREGLAVPAEFKPLIVLDEQGYLSLELPYEGNEELYARFDQWLMSACSHGDLCFAAEWLGTWHHVNSFRRLVQSQGGEGFSHLLAELPAANGGLTGPMAAEEVLSELDVLQCREHFGTRLVLLDADEGREIWEWSEGSEDKFLLNGRHGEDLQLDANGFALLQAGQVRFQSFQFTQTVLDPEKMDATGEGKVRFEDVLGGSCVDCFSPVRGRQIQWPDGSWEDDRGRIRLAYPRHLTTQWREVALSHYSDLIMALRRICQAALDTGNPVRWS